MPDQTPDRETALATLLALVREPINDNPGFKEWDRFSLACYGDPIMWLSGRNGLIEQVSYPAILAAFSDPAFRAEHGLLRPDEFVIRDTHGNVMSFDQNGVRINKVGDVIEDAKARVDAMWDKPPLVKVDVNLTMAPVPSDVLDRPGMLVADEAIVENREPSVQVSDLVAALRDLGWPEPDALSDSSAEWGNDPDANGLAIDASDREVSVWYDFSGERGDLTFDETVPFPRLVAAVDRLRWVLGLPERKVRTQEVVPTNEVSQERSSLVGAVSRLGRPWEPVV